MGFLKKFFNKLRSKREKESECWYNNYPEKEKGVEREPMMDPGALSGENQMYYNTAQQAAKHQN